MESSTKTTNYLRWYGTQPIMVCVFSKYIQTIKDNRSKLNSPLTGVKNMLACLIWSNGMYVIMMWLTISSCQRNILSHGLNSQIDEFCSMFNDMPPNSSKDPKVGPKMKQLKKNRVGARSLIHGTLRVGRCVGISGWIKTNSQVKVQDDTNLHNQEKKAINASEWKWCDEFSKNNLKHKLHMAWNLWEEAPLPSL